MDLLNPLQKASAVPEAAAFKIEFNEHVAELLSKDIYLYPTRAVVREVTTNAWDAGKGKPFNVTLPTRDKPQFIVEDFGPGLSDNDIYELYTTYFASRARNNDEKIGGFGLGAKSPFAVADSFLVSSRFEGKISVFLIFKENGMPKVTKHSCEDWGGATGLTVTVPTTDDRFKKDAATAAVITTIATLPITGGEISLSNIPLGWERTHQRTKEPPLYEDEHITVHRTEFPSYNSKTTILLEGVQYPADVYDRVMTKARHVSTSEDGEFIKSVKTTGYWVFSETFERVVVLINADPTKVKPNMSRESLALTSEQLDDFATTCFHSMKLFMQSFVASAPVVASPYLLPRLAEIAAVGEYFKVLPKLAPKIKTHPESGAEVAFNIKGAKVQGGSLYHYEKAGAAYPRPELFAHGANPITSLIQNLKTAAELIIVRDNVTSKAMSKAMHVFNGRSECPDGTAVLVLGDMKNYEQARLIGPGIILEDNTWNTLTYQGRPLRVRTMKRARALTFFKGPAERSRAVRNKPRPIRFRSEEPCTGWELPTVEELQAPFSEDQEFWNIAYEIPHFSVNWTAMSGAHPHWTLQNISAHARAILPLKDTPPAHQHLINLAAKIRFVGVSPAIYAKLNVTPNERVAELKKLTTQLIYKRYKATTPGTIVRSPEDLRSIASHCSSKKRLMGVLPTPRELEPKIAFFALQDNILGQHALGGLPKTSRVAKFLNEVAAGPFNGAISALNELMPAMSEGPGLYESVVKEFVGAITPKAAKKLARHVVLYLPEVVPSIASTEADKATLAKLIY